MKDMHIEKAARKTHWRLRLVETISVLVCRLAISITSFASTAICGALECYLLLHLLGLVQTLPVPVQGHLGALAILFERLAAVRLCVLLVFLTLSLAFPLWDFSGFFRLLLLALAGLLLSGQRSYENKNLHDTEAQTDPIEGQTPTKPAQRREFFSSLLAEDERWLDLLDRGYFVCRKNFSLVYANLTAQQQLRSLSRPFEQAIDQMIEQEEPHRPLRAVLEALLQEPHEGAMVKAHLRWSEDAQSSPATDKLKTNLFDNYTASLWKLRNNCALIILQTKGHSSSVTVADRLSNAVHCTLVHELKTLLSAVLGSLESFEEALEGENKISHGLAWSSCKILDSRLNDLFDYMQIQRRRLKLHIREFSLNKLVEEVVKIFEWQAQLKSLKLEVKKGPDLPDNLIGDCGRIQQVLVNLLSKAIEYTEYGTITLHITTKSNRRVCFKVASQSAGMQHKLRRNISESAPARRKRRYTNMPESPTKATENIEEMYLEMSQAICREMDTKIVAKCCDRSASYFKFMLVNGFPLKSPRLTSAAQRPRKYSNQRNKEEDKNPLERTQYPRSSDKRFESVLNCGNVQNINIINLSLVEPEASHLSKGMKSLFAPSKATHPATEIDLEIECEDIPEEFPCPLRLALRWNNKSPRFLQVPRSQSSFEPQLPLASQPAAPQASDNSPTATHPSVIVPLPSAFAPTVPLHVSAPAPEVPRDPLLQRAPPLGHSHPVSVELPKESPEVTARILLPSSRLKRQRRDSVQHTREELFHFVAKRTAADDVQSRSILIVDDYMNNRYVLKVILSKRGYNSVEASNGVEAVALVKDHLNKGTLRQLRLVFMDMQMPEMDGIEATETIIAMCHQAGVASPPIIGISSDRSEDDRLKFEKAGIREFMSKPVDSQRVAAALKKYIEHRA